MQRRVDEACLLSRCLGLGQDAGDVSRPVTSEVVLGGTREDSLEQKLDDRDTINVELMSSLVKLLKAGLVGVEQAAQHRLAVSALLRAFHDDVNVCSCR